MKRLVIVLGLIGIALTNAIPEAKRPNYDDVTYYSCKGKPDGNTYHPFDCTRFIICHNGRAADMACPECGLNNNPSLCAGNEWLVWTHNDTALPAQPTRNWCEWPALTECKTQEPETEAPTTEGPKPTTAATEPVETTVEDEVPVTDDEITTEAHVEPTTEPPVDDGDDECADAKAGDSCNPGDVKCDQCDVCVNMTSHYKLCKATVPSNPFEPVTGVWLEETCAEGQLINFNDKLASGLNGGLCTAWKDLSDEVKEEYLTNSKYEHCGLARDLCKYGQEEGDECTGNYYFLESTLHPEDKLAKSCPGKNIWDMATENCKPCNEVEACKGKC